MRINKESKIEIIAVGSELLTPYYIDTNTFYLTQRLNDIGMEVSFKTTVGDDWEILLCAIREALSRSHLIIASGGLGPTQDDKTREAFANALQRKLVFKKELLEKIKERFKRRGLLMPAVNERQSYIIEGACVLENRKGTAAGMWLDTGQQLIVLLPGPPYELESMFEESVWPRLKKSGRILVFRKVLKMADTTESEVETQISDLYDKSLDVGISTLAHPGQIEVHLRASTENGMNKARGKVKKVEKKILERLKDKVFSTSGEELEEIVGKILHRQKKTLAVAESCTGGLLSNRLTNIPGSSDYFLQGIVAYSKKAKIDNLGVPPSLLEKHGAVSPEVAKAMVRGIRKNTQSTYGLGITGIAGPSGGTSEKPVGLVYIALASEKGIECSKNIFLGNRENIKFQSTQKALDMLRKHLQKNKKSKRKR